MLKFKRYLGMALLILIAAVAEAQQSPITLKELLNRVNQKAPALLTDSAAILIRQAQAAEVRSNWLPNLRLNYQADIGSSNNVIGPYFGLGIVPSSSSGIHSTNVTTAASTSLGIAALDWEIYNFGAYRAANNVANSNITVGQNQYTQSKYNLQAYTIGNYLQLLRLQDYLGIQHRNIQRNQEIMRSIRSLARSGVKAGVDTSIAEAELSKARLNYIELNNQLKQVQLQISAISGVPYQTIIPDTTVELTLINQPNAYLFTADTTNHPLINYYKSLYQNSLQREDLVKKQYNPKVLLEAATWARGSSISPSDQYNTLSTGYGFQRSDYLVGVGISYNLFDLRRRQLKLQIQKANTNYAEKKLQEQQQLLSISASQADVEMETALNRLQEI
ncbi:MAG: TolC family protein, partial [Bacteroidota bacterium]|nr:TolC family protein [Bacteroidota bacterium]